MHTEIRDPQCLQGIIAYCYQELEADPGNTKKQQALEEAREALKQSGKGYR